MLRNIRAGSDVMLEMLVIDLSTGFPAPYDPDSVTLRLRDSLGNLSDLAIGFSSVKGYWTVQHHICLSAAEGPYTGTVEAIKGSIHARIAKFVPFVVTSQLPGHFEYLRLASPNAHVWYLSVSTPTITPTEAVVTINSSSPNDPCYSGVSLSPVVPTALRTEDTFFVSWWITISNAGTLTVANSDPGGTQQVISPQSSFSILGHDQVRYQLQAVPSGMSEALKPVAIAYPGL